MSEILLALFKNISSNWETFGALIAFTIVVTNFFTDRVWIGVFNLDPMNTTFKQICVAIFAGLLIWAGAFLRLGLFVDVVLFWHIFLLWVGTILVSFGIYDIEFVKALLEMLGIKLKKTNY